MKYVLAIDQGTTGTTALVLGADGMMCERSSVFTSSMMRA